MLNRFVLVLAISISLFGCKVNKAPQERQHISDYDLENFSCSNYNQDSSKVICEKPLESGMGMKLSKFIIIDLVDSTVIYDENMQFAKLNWVNNIEIEVNKGIGTMSEDNGREIYHINLETFERTSLGDSQK